MPFQEATPKQNLKKKRKEKVNVFFSSPLKSEKTTGNRTTDSNIFIFY